MERPAFIHISDGKMGEMHALKAIYDETYINHNYLFEPQSRQYMAHGDICDYLYQQASAEPRRVFLPLTLEMGSWLWVKKNPRQIFSRHGIFNPLIGHRQQRVLRRHLSWLDGSSAKAREREGTILRLTRKLARNCPRIVETWSAWQIEHPVSHSNALRQLWAASRYHAPSRKPDVRMLVLASAGDTLVDPRCSRRLAHLWQTDFAVHPAAGHDIPLDDGTWAARQVRNWLLGAITEARQFGQPGSEYVLR